VIPSTPGLSACFLVTPPRRSPPPLELAGVRLPERRFVSRAPRDELLEAAAPGVGKHRECRSQPPMGKIAPPGAS
jgi:hypothetical protein